MSKDIKIFTTGAFLKPVELKDMNGQSYWRWIVDEFIDDSYKEGHVYNPPEYSYDLTQLTNYIVDSEQ